MIAPAPEWLRYFRLLLWNRWAEFNETWQEARSQWPLPRLNFGVDRKTKMAILALDLPKHFRLHLWNRWSEFNATWQEGRSKSFLPSFVFFGPIGKPEWPKPLIRWDIFDFSSETAKQNSTKIDRKPDLDVRYQVSAFQVDQKIKIVAPADPSTMGHIHIVLRWPKPLIRWDIVDFFSEPAERNSSKIDSKRYSSVLYKVRFFSGRSENQDGPPCRSISKGDTFYSGARYVALWALFFLK